jgi:superfamily II DNA or RNA helicase
MNSFFVICKLQRKYWGPKEMSLLFDIDKMSEEKRERVANLRVRIDKPKPWETNNYSVPQYMYPYRVTSEKKAAVPFAWGLNNIEGKRPTRDHFESVAFEFKGDLRDNQKVIRKEAIDNLNKRGSIIISAYPGFGKTVTAINLIKKIGLKAIILVNKVVLMKQWVEAAKSFTDLRGDQILRLSPPTKAQRENHSKLEKWKTKLSNASLIIVNALNVPKMENFFSDVGTVIVDECHQIMSKCMSEALLYLHPRYLVGLSATPYRTDGLDSLLDLYFSRERLTRELMKPHTVYQVVTDFKPSSTLTEQGRLNWNVLLNSQSDDEKRNRMIIDTTKKLKNRIILILTKRVSQAEYLKTTMKNEGVSVDGLYGTSSSFDKDCRVLVGTSSKIGVGFDHKRLDCLILASDVKEYFIQFLGRVFRSPKTEPIIIDFVDSHPVLKRHFRTRKKVYTKHGGKIIKTTQNDLLRKLGSTL